jgi:predicted O-methyltransferase YrrM
MQKFIGYLILTDYKNRFTSIPERINLRYQNEKFFKNGLNRSKALDKLNDVLLSIYGEKYSENKGMWSEHLILLSAISELRPEIKQILEIGTFRGETTSILSRLFPGAEVTTIDLEFNEILKKEMYSYLTQAEALKKARSVNFGALENIKFIEMNSLKLTNYNMSFDLIWIDGDHSNPVVALDIGNAIRLLAKNGIAMCDDVYVNKKNAKQEGKFLASLATLESFAKVGLIKYELFYKRIGVLHNFPRYNMKYIGFFVKEIDADCP